MTKHRKTGLVLSGGGAKGAYQVGVVKALVELGLAVDVLSGTSIGALNGAVLTSSPSLAAGAETLEEIWRRVAETPPVAGDVPPLVKMLENADVEITPEFRGKAIVAKGVLDNLLDTIKSPETEALVDNTPLKALLRQYVSHEKLARGLPLYVSVFPNTNTFDSVIGSALAFLGIKENPDSEFLLLQSLSAEDQNKALLASAAIPFLFKAQEIRGKKYVDGGLGGFAKLRGNTLIEPLIDAGCDESLVTYLSEHTRWTKDAHKGAKIVPISREKSINRAPILPEMFDVIAFSAENIDSWIEQGYEDTLRYFKNQRT